jgi:alkylhydroperoxidase family enzyme
LVTAAREAQPLPEPRLEALARFTEAVIASRGRASDAQLEAFQTAGFSTAQALDVILGVSLASLCNFANNFAQPPLNRELEAYRFEPKG